MKVYLSAFVLSCSSFVAACGSDVASSATAPSQLTVPMQGSVQAFPIPATESVPNFNNFQMRLFDASAVWADKSGGASPAAQALYDTSLVGMSSTCAASGCAYLIANQNVANVSPNMVALITGNLPASEALWAPVYTNIVDSQSLVHAQAHRGTLTANAPAYAISRYGLKQLATQLNIADANTLLARGLIIGMLRGKDPTDFLGGLPSGVPGVKINLSPAQAAAVTLHYPNDDYTTAKVANSTNADGAFYLVGNTAGATLPSTTLDINAGSAGAYLWTNRPIAMMSGSVIVAPLSALP